MLNIPTATKGARAGTRTPEQRQQFLTNKAGQTPGGTSLTPQSEAGPGMTSMAATPPTALSQTTPYEYAGHGSQDPIARQVMQDYWSGPGWKGAYDTNVFLADAYDKAGGASFNSPLSPASWGTVYKGQDYADIADKYKAAGGTYFNQFTPAQQAGVPYNAATGEAAPVMNMQTGVAEVPTFDASGKITGHTPTSTAASGSFHTVQPQVMNRMWR